MDEITEENIQEKINLFQQMQQQAQALTQQTSQIEMSVNEIERTLNEIEDTNDFYIYENFKLKNNYIYL